MAKKELLETHPDFKQTRCEFLISEAHLFVKCKEEGIKEGIEQGRKKGIKQGRKEGIKQGRKEGIEQGREEGIVKTKHEIAKRLLEIGGISVKDISKVTGISPEQIKKPSPE